MVIHNLAAMQHVFHLSVAQTRLDSALVLYSWSQLMGLTRPINALMICASFAIIGALIMGVLP